MAVLPLRVGRIIRPRQSEPRQREWVRAILAFLLVVIFGFEIWAGIHAMTNPEIVKDEHAVNAVKDLFLIVLSPTVALVGAAIGFYYGTKT